MQWISACSGWLKMLFGGIVVSPCCSLSNNLVASVAVMLAQIKHMPIVINNE
jgi:hypothetical protein